MEELGKPFFPYDFDWLQNLDKISFNIPYFSQEYGDVNISALLNSFQMGYDKRVRPNYGGEFNKFHDF